MRKLALLLRIFLLSAAALLPSGACSQTFSLANSHPSLIIIDGQWRFHAGDDPGWANPAFDDSRWSLLRSDRSWTLQGYPNYSGIGWYRFQVQLPSSMDEASLMLPPILTCFQVFVDGELAGTYGKMPPNATPYIGGPDNLVLPLPHGNQQPRNVQIAIRVWDAPSEFNLGGGGPVANGGLVGATRTILARQRQAIAAASWALTGAQSVAALQTLVSLGAMVLFLLRRKETEYLWFSALMLSTALVGWENVSFPTLSWNLTAADLTGTFAGTVAGLASIAFYQKLLATGASWLRTVAIVATLLNVLLLLVSHAIPGLITLWLEALLSSLTALPLDLWIIAVLFSGVRRRSTDARLLLVPVLINTGVELFANAASITNMLGWQHKLINYILLTRQPFEIELHQVTSALYLLAVFAILILRFARTRSQEEQYASEVEGARHVQQFLIPEDLPRVPGLTIESDYRPAREVGGDFFQVIPSHEDGSALVFVGDVAGKGMQAGMLATLLVGAMRTAATFTRDPAIILSTLNNRLHGKGNATCLALLIEVSGAATLVNAGHLPPYLNGAELPMEGALPLGTIPDIEFPTLHFQIHPGDTLTLISDGILEAQKPDGELFGFDRIAEHLRSHFTAASLANAAQDFGHAEQADDITVITIARIAPTPA
jgi:hypothetical protein